ncbi:MAG: S8 family serine peptidase [Caldilineaceae bacterium]
MLVQWLRHAYTGIAGVMATGVRHARLRAFRFRQVSFVWIIAVTAGLSVVFAATLPSQAQTVPDNFQPPVDHLLWQLPGDREAYRTVPFAAGELLVGFHGEEGTRSAAGVLATFSATAVERIDLRGLDGATGDAGVQGYLLAVPPGQEWTVMEQLLQEPSVAFVTPNWLVFAATPPTVESEEAAADAAIAKPEQPFLINDPKYEEAQWYLQRINASRAWSLAYAEDGFAAALETVQVAIVDSGIDVNHPEFRGRLLPGYNYLAPGSQPVDDYGHGTHVAGLIGAVANNASGIAGVAPKVRIDARKVLNSQGSGTISNVSKAIRDAADSGAAIINLSLEASASNPTMEAAVQYAYSKGALLIAAAGNFYPAPVSWPAAYEEVIAVAATNYNDKHASYSNAGAQVELAAPGGERSLSMLSTWPGGVKCRDNAAVLPQSDYCTSEGTSMAAAVVSGAAALVKSVQPGYTAEQIRQLLRETAVPPSESATLVGSGRLDLHTALRTALNGKLQLATTTFVNRVAFGAAPYQVVLRLDNPSLQPLTWRATLLNSQEWVQINGATGTVLTDTVVYGAPAYLSLTVTPTQLITGSYAATVRVDQVNANDSAVSTFVDINLLIGTNQTNYFYFPLVVQGQSVPVTTPSFQWEMPLQVEDRSVHGMTDNSSIGFTLPFTFTLRNKAYTSARIFSEGFISFPDVEISGSLANRCLPNLTQPAQAIYGWWANLNPTRVSTFQPATDRVVIEFENVPVAGTTPAYQVSFQIVLYRNGDVRLNYLEAPVAQTAMPAVTIGIEGRDGLFYNQVACSDGTTQVGYLPSSRQTLYFNAKEDIY